MMKIDDRMSRESVALLCLLARNAGDTCVPIYAPGLVQLAQFYLDNKPAPSIPRVELRSVR
jgi:hypothetical protein